ncbi:HAMP domain-containing sensor histidine kinase [Chitinophaga sp. CB10]|uniref:sensor histidine kinase n=1 Tax=Chitinophaga sp. CB10 TaxID=1891659 RepID=UPI0025BC6F90|nr:HAMP domain-containing sensor histidine kinase [Chitinophaga sp. CB10]
MKIKYKIALYYTLSATLMLMIFAVLVYYLSAKSRKAEYLERLEYRARSIANVIVEDGHVKVDLLRKLDRTTFQDLYKESILVYNPSYDLLYSNLKDTTIRTHKSLLDYIRENKSYSYDRGGGGEVVGIYYTEGNVSVIVIVSSFDKYGFQNLQNLSRILLLELATAILVLVAVGYFFARKMVRPIDKLVTEVDSINANNLQDRQVAVQGKDEIAVLAANFNTMLQRLSESFDLQKSFVSNASHELRTPLASIISQLQVTLSKERSAHEYQEILQSVLEDAESLTDLTNGLLQLAQSEMKSQEFVFSDVRIDELLMEMANLVRLKQRESRIEIQFNKVPDNDLLVTCFGNESLLKVLFINLVDNACKFSKDNTAHVTIDFFTQYITVQVKDNGIGIPADDLQKIFEPFYRGSNAQKTRGHGLGLSICKKIVQIHKGHLTVTSTPGHGSTFTVLLPHLGANA